MHKIFSLILLSLTFFPSVGRAIPQPFPTTLDPALLDQVHSLFPPGQEVAPSLIDYRINPNLRLFREAEIRVTFIDEGASLQNSFGYFLYEDANHDGLIAESEIQKQLLLPNVSKENSGGEMKVGDTVSLGRFPAGSRIGFYLIANGALEPEATYYTIDSLNPDGQRHLAMLALADRQNVILGIEDLPIERSDRDFNDILFTFTTDPKSALEEVIEDSDIPVVPGTPAPTPLVKATPNPAEQEAPSDVSFQESKGPAVIEGSGLGCQLGGERNPESWSLLCQALLALLIFRIWKPVLRI